MTCRPLATSLLLAAGLAAATASVALAAQAPMKYLDHPVGPRSLPGDGIPPFGVLDDEGRYKAPPNAASQGPRGGLGPPQESFVAGPSLKVSLAGAQAAVDECARLGAFGAVAVVDLAGDARAMLSVDGADGSHVFVAQRKALVALEFEMPGDKVAALARAGDAAVLKRIKPNMFVQFGSYPILAKGKLIGAIGYSGGADEKCALAGLKAIEAALG